MLYKTISKPVFSLSLACCAILITGREAFSFSSRSFSEACADFRKRHDDIRTQHFLISTGWLPGSDRNINRFLRYQKRTGFAGGSIIQPDFCPLRLTATGSII
jgi:hypothetical protein